MGHICIIILGDLVHNAMQECYSGLLECCMAPIMYVCAGGNQYDMAKLYRCMKVTTCVTGIVAS